MNSPSTQASDSPPLALYAKFVVCATFGLLYLGSLVTSHGAGMAVPDWPLSFGSINPAGWIRDHQIALEHSHRLLGMLIGILVGVLCAWVWQGWRALGAAALVSAIVPPLVMYAGASKVIAMHARIWPAALTLIIGVLWSARGRTLARPAATRWLALAAFAAVCVQGVFGGLRVTHETAQMFESAMALRIVHGSFAQFVLCLLVALALMLTSRWRMPALSLGSRPALRALAVIAPLAVFTQLILGATMRHNGAGLAITTFPQASPDGAWLPSFASGFVALNFWHTRIGAVVVTVVILALAIGALRAARGEGWLARPAWGLIGLVFLQSALGMFVIWHTKPPTLTSLHVVNGAAILALTLLLSLRLHRVSHRPPAPESTESAAEPLLMHRSV